MECLFHIHQFVLGICFVLAFAAVFRSSFLNGSKGFLFCERDLNARVYGCDDVPYLFLD